MSESNHTLWDAFVIEMEDLLPEVEVLQQRRSAVPDPQRVLVVGHGDALLSRQPQASLVDRLVRLAALTELEQTVGVLVRCRISLDLLRL